MNYSSLSDFEPIPNIAAMNPENRAAFEPLSFWDLYEGDQAIIPGAAAAISASIEPAASNPLPTLVTIVPEVGVLKPRKMDRYAKLLFDLQKDGLDEPSNGLHSTLELTSVYGDKHARNYQIGGIKFGLGYDNDQLVSKPDRSVRVCIADQMRLGKTPQSLLIIKNLMRSNSIKKPLIIVKSANLWQWIDEHKTWVTSIPNGIWPILGSKAFIPSGFTSYIISMDTIRTMENTLINEKFDCIIADEAHSFKNLDSSRSIALSRIIRESNISNIIFLTGTPILNRADEYKFILKEIAPEFYVNEATFTRNWLDLNSKSSSGKYNRIKPYRLQEFKEAISGFIIRREKEDVYTDLPEFNTMYTIVKVEAENLKKLYNLELDKIAERQAKGENITSTDPSLMTLRRICGMAKIDPALDYIKEFIEESEDEKIAIGIHHKDVRETLKLKIPKGYGVVTLSGEDSAQRKYDIQEDIMKHHENRVMIINSLAGGVGMDFHYINNFLVLERQWNGAMEKQFEFRFYNPDKSIKTHSTFGEYFIAKGTVDEFWHSMVMNKKKVVGEASENNWSIEADSKAMKMLIEETLENRL